MQIIAQFSRAKQTYAHESFSLRYSIIWFLYQHEINLNPYRRVATVRGGAIRVSQHPRVDKGSSSSASGPGKPNGRGRVERAGLPEDTIPGGLTAGLTGPKFQRGSADRLPGHF